jgi:hypothetical protein
MITALIKELNKDLILCLMKELIINLIKRAHNNLFCLG